MFTRQSCLLLLLAGAAGVAAAPLPARWSLDLGSHELGWRFRQEFAVWPGPYWRGPGQPPLAARRENPSTWGLLRLGDSLDGPAPVETATVELIAPLVADRPRVDGMLGWDEWSGAAQAVEPLDLGEAWVIYAQHTADTLYICIASPSTLTVREGQVAELYLAPDEAGKRGARLLRLRADREQRPELQSFALTNGQWTPEPLAKGETPNWRGAVTGRGDGAWTFAVYEFAVPLAPAEGAVPEQLRFMARLQNLTHGGAVGMARSNDPESVIWPDNRSSWANASRPPVGLRPDFWQALLLRPEDTSDGVSVPLTTRAIKPDGQIGIKEWAEARMLLYRLPGDQWRRLWLVRDQENLYVAVRLCVARGVRRDEACQLYLDPVGDGGLQPRGDDLQIRLPLGVESVTQTLRAVGPAWGSAGFGDVKGAGYPVSSYESTYEFALPLSALGPDLRPHLAVEVVYGLPQ